MFIIFFIAWVIFNGRITVEIALFGVAISAAVYWFICRFMDYSVQKDMAMAKKLGKILHYLGTLFVEIVKANLAVLGFIYGHKTVHPEIVTFDAPLHQPTTQTVLADSITLTPGTISAQQKDNHYMVHCLDKSMSEDLDRSVFVKELKGMEDK